MPGGTDPFERLLSGVDEEFERDNPLATRLVGLMTAIQGLRQNMPARGPIEAYEEREALARQWKAEASKFFIDLEGSGWECAFDNGSTELAAHCLRPLGQEFALFDAVILAPGDRLIIDYAAEHNVPQEALDHDLLTRSSDRRQLYVGDTSRQIAASLNQVAVSLLRGGSLFLQAAPRTI